MKAIWVRFLCVLWIAMCLLPGQAFAVDYNLSILDSPFTGTASSLSTLSAPPGDTITVTVTRASGWQLERVEYILNAAPGRAYPATKVSDTEFQFIMPDDNVRVDVISSVIDPILHTLEGGTEIPYGGSLTLAVQNAGIYGNSPWAWQKDNARIPGENGTTLTVTEAGDYQAVVLLGGYPGYSNVLSITEAPPSSENSITGFTITGQVGATNIQGTSITVTMPYGTDASRLIPAIQLSDFAGVQPASGMPQDFTAPVRYTVTAQDGSFREYLVTVDVQGSPDKEITGVTISGQLNMSMQGDDITVTMPYGTDVRSLAPTISYIGASVFPPSGVAQDFTAPVPYTVFAQDGSFREYRLAVAVQGSPDKEITGFTIPGQVGTTNIQGMDISLTMPHGTDVRGLIPTIVHTGTGINPASGTTQDFTAPVRYTVTARDGTEQHYTATVNVQLPSDREITGFAVPGQVGSTVISGTDIRLTMPAGTDVRGLIPAILHTGATVSPGDGVAQDFTAPVVYTVTARDGQTRAYTVTVTVQQPLPSNREITAFTIPGQVGATVISGTSIKVTMPYGTDVTRLVPAITHTGAAMAPASGAAQDFTAPVTYTVTARDGQQTAYTVTVVIGAQPQPEPPINDPIKSFKIPGQVGTTVIDGTKISVTVPYGTDVTNLSPVIDFTGTSITPGSGAAQDFTNPVTYIVTLPDGSTVPYAVTVTIAPFFPNAPAGQDAREPLKQPAKVFEKGRIIGVTEWANVRGGPSTDDEVVGEVYLDEIVELLEWSADGLWCRVRFDGGSRIGWVYYKFIEPIGK